MEIGDGALVAGEFEVVDAFAVGAPEEDGAVVARGGDVVAGGVEADGEDFFLRGSAPNTNTSSWMVKIRTPWPSNSIIGARRPEVLGTWDRLVEAAPGEERE